MEDGEKEDTAKEEEQAEALWADVTKRKKRRCGQKVEKPEAFMANFFKGLEIYQTKLLVSTLPPSHSGAGVGAGRPQRGGHCLCFTIQLVVLPHLSHSSSLPLLDYLLVPSVLEGRESENVSHSVMSDSLRPHGL